MPRFGFEQETLHVRHPLRIKDTIEMIAFVLHDAGMESPRGAGNGFALVVEPAIADMPRPFDITAKPRNREAALPAPVESRIDNLNLRIDQHGQRRRVVEHLGTG